MFDFFSNFFFVAANIRSQRDQTPQATDPLVFVFFLSIS